MLNSVAAGWRLARRVVALQAAVTVATALVSLLSSRDAALGALAGGTAMTLGSLLAAWGAFAGGVAGAGVALWRLLSGTALKWIVVVGGMYLAIAAWHMPALPVLAGAAMAAAAWLIAAKLWT
ncbi:MAG TPA: ATP synthase subunit I [Lysobacter sp.]|nr:ATP synthase subunit I [Lysobacter sp.]